MHHLLDFAAWVMPSHTPLENEAIGLRLIHFLAGITWVGLLYFFNLVNVPFMKTVDAAAKPKILEHLTLPALNFFRWSSLITVFVGFWYWTHVYVSSDAKITGGSVGGTVGLFFLVWIAAWWIFYAFVKKVPNPWLLVVIVLALVIAAGWLFVTYTPVGRDDNHVLSIGVGGGIGVFMMFNVWGIIWPNNKRIIKGTLAGTPPPNAATLARQAFLASRANFYLSVPMLFFIAATSHYPILGR